MFEVFTKHGKALVVKDVDDFLCLNFGTDEYDLLKWFHIDEVVLRIIL